MMEMDQVEISARLGSTPVRLGPDFIDALSAISSLHAIHRLASWQNESQSMPVARTGHATYQTLPDPVGYERESSNRPCIALIVGFTMRND